MDSSRLSHCWVRYVHYTALEVAMRPCGHRSAHGAYRASDTAACRAQTGSSRFASDESPSRTAEISAQLTSDEPCSACG